MKLLLGLSIILLYWIFLVQSSHSREEQQLGDTTSNLYNTLKSTECKMSYMDGKALNTRLSIKRKSKIRKNHDELLEDLEEGIKCLGFHLEREESSIDRIMKDLDGEKRHLISQIDQGKLSPDELMKASKETSIGPLGLLLEQDKPSLDEAIRNLNKDLKYLMSLTGEKSAFNPREKILDNPFANLREKHLGLPCIAREKGNSFDFRFCYGKNLHESFTSHKDSILQRAFNIDYQTIANDSFGINQNLIIPETDLIDDVARSLRNYRQYGSMFTRIPAKDAEEKAWMWSRLLIQKDRVNIAKAYYDYWGRMDGKFIQLHQSLYKQAVNCIEKATNMSNLQEKNLCAQQCLSDYIVGKSNFHRKRFEERTRAYNATFMDILELLSEIQIALEDSNNNNNGEDYYDNDDGFVTIKEEKIDRTAAIIHKLRLENAVELWLGDQANETLLYTSAMNVIISCQRKYLKVSDSNWMLLSEIKEFLKFYYELENVAINQDD